MKIDTVMKIAGLMHDYNDLGWKRKEVYDAHDIPALMVWFSKLEVKEPALEEFRTLLLHKLDDQMESIFQKMRALGVEL